MSKLKPLFLETINLLSFIIYTYSKQEGNLEPAKRCPPYASLQLWDWILKSDLQHDAQIMAIFKKQTDIFEQLLTEHFEKTLTVALELNGMWQPRAGIH